MTPIRSKTLFFSSLLLILLVIWYETSTAMNFDFGIYLGVGEYITTHWLPKTDPFSYTMPSYPYIDHEWLSQIIIAKLYYLLGYSLLALIFAGLAIGSFLITRPKNIKPYSFTLLLLAAASTFLYTAIRPQVFSWLLLALILKLGLEDRLWQKYQGFLPLVFALWANLHGAFAGGLVTLIIIVFFRSIADSKQRLTNILVLLGSLAATSINPYGIQIWDEIFITISDQTQSATIGEWQSILSGFSPGQDLSVVIYFLITIVLISKYLRRLNKIELAVYFFWLILALFSRRHIPIWLILSLPASYHGLELFFADLKLRSRSGWVSTVGIVGSLLTLIIFIYQARFDLQLAYPLMENFFYPKNAIRYLTENNIEGNIFNEFNWGGYLLWKLPGRKLFVDGRMASWRTNSPRPGESQSAFEEYNLAATGPIDYQPIFKKYNIKVVLWPTRYFLQGNLDVLDTTNIKDITLPADPLVMKLLDDGWKREYVDLVSYILVAPGNTK